MPLKPTALLARLTRQGLRHCPALADLGVRHGTSLALRLSPSRLEQLQINLACAHPTFDRRHIQHLARRCVIDQAIDQARQYRLELLSPQELDREIAAMHLHGNDSLARAISGPRPLIYVTAHYGAFMLAALKAAREFPQRRLNFFYNPATRNTYASTSDGLLSLVNRCCGILHNTPAGILAALKRLRSGESLCIVADQLNPHGEPVFVPFFGRFYAAMPGVAYLAHRADALIVPAFACRRPSGRTVLTLMDPIDPSDCGGDGEAEIIYVTTCRLFAAFEQQFRHAPTPWRYWTTFRIRSLAAPLPPVNLASARAGLDLLQPLLAADRALQTDADLWSAMRDSLA